MAREPDAGPSKNEWECGECGSYNDEDERICHFCQFDRDGNPPEVIEEDVDEE